MVTALHHAAKSVSIVVWCFVRQGRARCCIALQLAAEVAVLQQLQHESLVSYLFIVDEGARLSIVMDWAGQGLRDLVQRQHQQQHQLGEDIARHITYQLTSSLVYLHQKVGPGDMLELFTAQAVPPLALCSSADAHQQCCSSNQS